jgi:hypothetical protein
MHSQPETESLRLQADIERKTRNILRMRVCSSAQRFARAQSPAVQLAARAALDTDLESLIFQERKMFAFYLNRAAATTEARR